VIVPRTSLFLLSRVSSPPAPPPVPIMGIGEPKFRPPFQHIFLYYSTLSSPPLRLTSGQILFFSPLGRLQMRNWFTPTSCVKRQKCSDLPSPLLDARPQVFPSLPSQVSFPPLKGFSSQSNVYEPFSNLTSELSFLTFLTPLASHISPPSGISYTLIPQHVFPFEVFRTC